jgi:ABC-type branched-subunit amino acid transport system substrate-binding protein
MAVLYQNDDLGKDYLVGLKKALGAKADQFIVKEASLEVTDPTIDSQIVSLQGSGADVLFSFATVKFSSLAIRKVSDLGWKPLMFVPAIANSVGTVLKPAGLEKSVGLITATYVKDPSDPQWQDDPAVKDWRAWMDKYVPNGDKSDISYVYGTIWGATLAQLLKQCGSDLSRENIMRQATNLHGVAPPMLLPGITINTNPTDYRVLKQARLQRFDGQKWVLFGDILTAE